MKGLGASGGGGGRFLGPVSREGPFLQIIHNTTAVRLTIAHWMNYLPLLRETRKERVASLVPLTLKPGKKKKKTKKIHVRKMSLLPVGS